MHRRKQQVAPHQQAAPASVQTPKPGVAQPVAQPVPSTPVLQVPTVTAEMLQMKEQLTAPYMLYDATVQRIVSNPTYNRLFMSEVHRLQSIVLTHLRTPMQVPMTYTPKELLYKLEAVLYYLCASACVTDNMQSFSYVLDDLRADVVMPQLESFLSHHDAPAKTTMTLAYCLTEGTSYEVLHNFVAMLEKRLQSEMNPDVHRKRTLQEQQALQATANNTRDVLQLLRDLRTAYRSIETLSQAQRLPSVNETFTGAATRSNVAANTVAANLVMDGYYRVLRWVMAVDVDRRALQRAVRGDDVEDTLTKAPTEVSAAAVESLSLAEASAAAALAIAAGTDTKTTPGPPSNTPHAFAKVTEFDPFSGRLVLERDTLNQRWGLSVSGDGLLIGLENELRNSSEAGERIYDAIQQWPKGTAGLVIVEINGHHIRPMNISEEKLVKQRPEMLDRLHRATSQPTMTLELSLQKREQAELTTPLEIFFEVSHQGGENGVGQKSMLMLQRASPAIPWGLQLRFTSEEFPLLINMAKEVRLSDSAKTFFFDMRGRVRVLKVNHEDTRTLSPAEVRERLTSALVMTLHLQVADEQGHIPEMEAMDAAANEDEGWEGEEEEQVVEVVRNNENGRDAPQPRIAANRKMDGWNGKDPELDAVADFLANEFMRERGHQDAQEELPANDAVSDDLSGIEGEEWAGEEEEDAELTRAVRVHKAELMPENPAPESFVDLDWTEPTTIIHAAEEEEGEGNDGEDWAQVGEDENVINNALLQQHNILPDDADGDDAHAIDRDAESILNAITTSNNEDEEMVEQQEPAMELIEEAGPAPAAVAETNTATLTVERKTEKPHSHKRANTAKGGHRKKAAAAKVKKAAAAKVKKAAAAKAKKAAAAKANAARADAMEEGVEEGNEEELDAETAKKAPRNRQSAPRTANSTSAVAAVMGSESLLLSPEEEEAAAETPLVSAVPTAAELAVAASNIKKKINKIDKKTTTKEQRGGKAAAAIESELESPEAPAAESASSPPVIRIPQRELRKATPLEFTNHVKMESFDGARLEVVRHDVSQPWEIKVAMAGDDMIMTRLPPTPINARNHPFLRALGAGTNGEVQWVVEGVNGQDFTGMSKQMKAKTLGTIKGMTKLSFALRALRR